MEPAVIVAILVLNAVVAVLQTRSAEGSMDALARLQPETSCVLRDGEWVSEYPKPSGGELGRISQSHLFSSNRLVQGQPNT